MRNLTWIHLKSYIVDLIALISQKKWKFSLYFKTFETKLNLGTLTGVSRAISAIERGGSHDGQRGSDHRLQTSKSETSLADSDAFVLISESEVREAQIQQITQQETKKKLPKNPLMPGRF